MSGIANKPDVCNSEFNKIYNETFAPLRKYVAVMCSDINYISDILQETYFDFYKIISKKGINYIDNPLSVLLKIAKRKVYRYYSLKDKLKIFIPIIKKNKDNEEYLITDEQEIYEQLPQDAILQNIEAQRLWAVIETYSADIRKILYLYFYEDLTLFQIADKMNYGISKVKHKLYRTLDEIRKKEQENE